MYQHLLLLRLLFKDADDSTHTHTRNKPTQDQDVQSQTSNYIILIKRVNAHTKTVSSSHLLKYFFFKSCELMAVASRFGVK